MKKKKKKKKKKTTNPNLQSFSSIQTKQNHQSQTKLKITNHRAGLWWRGQCRHGSDWRKRNGSDRRKRSGQRQISGVGLTRAAVEEAALLRKERNLELASSWSSRKRSCWTLNAPFAYMITKPSINIEMRNDPTVVRKTMTTIKSERLIS